MVAKTITADLAIASNRDYRLMVARGDIAGAEPFGAYGERDASAGETNRVIWPNGVFTVPPEAGIQMEVSSTSADDAAGGTGIRSVEIHYLDGILTQQYEEVTLNGTTPVNTVATDIRFIQCTHVVTFGSSPEAAGEISVQDTTGTTTYSKIAQGDTRCASSARMVPANKVCFVAGATGSATSGTGKAKVKIRLNASEITEQQLTYPLALIPFGSISLQDGSEAFNFPLPLRFSEGTVIAMTGTTDKDAQINGSWYGWIENASGESE